MVTTAMYLAILLEMDLDAFEVLHLCTGLLALCAQAHH